MRFSKNEDIVKFFRTLVNDFKPVASENDVALSFQTKITNTSISHYNPDYIQKEITKFLTNLIKYIPRNNKITVLFNEYNIDDEHCTLTITNSGVNLIRVSEINNTTIFKTETKAISDSSTEFTIEIPVYHIKPENENEVGTKLNLSPYYLEIGKRLSNHFSKQNNFLPDALQVKKNETDFLKKINTLLSSKLEDNTFSVVKFAEAMAMSRTKLFRKTKAITSMSPRQYILYFRLQAAKELLQAKDLDLNISDVCYSVGFMSKSHFTRSFQKQFGMLPSQIKH